MKAKLPHNQKMQDFLAQHGIVARVKYIEKGSLKHSWRLHNPDIKWSEELAEKVTKLGFTNIWGQPLGKYEGNGGVFSIFVKGHNEFLN